MGPLFLAVAAALWSSRSGYLQKKSSRKLYHGLSCLTGGFLVYLVGTGLPYVTPFSRIRRFCLSVGLFVTLTSFFFSSRAFLLLVAVVCISFAISFFISNEVNVGFATFSSSIYSLLAFVGISCIPLAIFLFRSNVVMIYGFFSPESEPPRDVDLTFEADCSFSCRILLSSSSF